MKLYPKKLHSIAALEREKTKLLKKSRESDKELFSLDGLPEPAINFIENNFSSVGDNVATFLKDKTKNVLFSVGKEFISGYLKWKVIELSYKGIRHLIKKQRAKRPGVA